MVTKKTATLKKPRRTAKAETTSATVGERIRDTRIANREAVEMLVGEIREAGLDIQVGKFSTFGDATSKGFEVRIGDTSTTVTKTDNLLALLQGVMIALQAK